MVSRAVRWFAIMMLVAAAACGQRAPKDWTPVKRGELILAVDVIGTLKSEDSDLLGPPQIPDQRDFKIARMASEGKKVKKGDMVLAFDFTDLKRELELKQTEADATEKELEKRQADASMTRQNLRLMV